MVERQLKNRKAVNFGETLDPDTRGIWDNGRYVGIILFHEGEVVVEWRTKNDSPLRTPIYLLEAVVKEKHRIIKERKQK